MVKAHLLTGMIAIMAVGGLTACGNSSRPLNSPETEKNARIIVEVDKNIEGLSEEEILASQSKLINKIACNVTSNFEKVDSYTVLVNAFTLDVDSKDIEAIRNLSHSLRCFPDSSRLGKHLRVYKDAAAGRTDSCADLHLSFYHCLCAAACVLHEQTAPMALFVVEG